MANLTNKFDCNKVFFTSDCHFDHANIIKYCSRPFESADEMNRQLILNWNKVVQWDDTVFILGDFCFGQKTRWEKILPQLNGNKYLILGNHDKLKYIPENGFEAVERQMMITITKDEEGLCLWRTKPALNEDGVWWEDDEDYEEINSCIYYSITGYADLPKEGEIIEIDVTLVSPSQQLESKKYIKTRKHK